MTDRQVEMQNIPTPEDIDPTAMNAFVANLYQMFMEVQHNDDARD